MKAEKVVEPKEKYLKNLFNNKEPKIKQRINKDIIEIINQNNAQMQSKIKDYFQTDG